MSRCVTMGGSRGIRRWISSSGTSSWMTATARWRLGRVTPGLVWVSGVQLATVRFLGTFLADPTEVPEVAVRYAADQLGIDDPGSLDGYVSVRARWAHVSEIKARYGYRDFHDRRECLGLGFPSNRGGLLIEVSH